MEGIVEYKGMEYKFELDDSGWLWISNEKNISKINIGQIKPIEDTAGLRGIVIEMLERGGY